MTNDLWELLILFLQCLILGTTIVTVFLITMRATFYFKSFRDPINAIRKEKKLQDILDNQREQNEIAGNRLSE